MKEKLFKLLFPSKYEEIEFLIEDNEYLMDSIEILKEEEPRGFLEPLDFFNVDGNAKPPHFLKDLNEDARKQFIATMEGMYSDEKFQKVISYVINVLGNHSFQVEPDETKMRNGRFAVLGIRTLMKEFEKMHSEYVGSKKKVEEFDHLEILPEVN